MTGNVEPSVSNMSEKEEPQEEASKVEKEEEEVFSLDQIDARLLIMANEEHEGTTESVAATASVGVPKRERRASWASRMSSNPSSQRNRRRRASWSNSEDASSGTSTQQRRNLGSRFSFGLPVKKRLSKGSSFGATSSPRKSIWTKLANNNNKDVWAETEIEEDESFNFGAMFRGVWNVFRISAKEKRNVVRRHPMVIGWSLIVLTTLCTTGILIILRRAEDEENDRIDEAAGVASQTSIWFSAFLSRALVPIFTLSQFVQQLPILQNLPEQIGVAGAPGSLPLLPPRTPDGYPTHRNVTGSACMDPDLIDRFTEIASSIKRDLGLEKVLVNLQLAPAAVVCLLHPLNNTEDFEPPLFLDNSGALGHDLLSDPARKFVAESTLLSEGVGIAGPLTLRQCPDCDPTVREAFIARLAIDGLNDDQIVTIDGVEHKKWGFATALYNWEPLLAESGVQEGFELKNMQFRISRTVHTFDDETNSFTVTHATITETEGGFDLDEKDTYSESFNITDNTWLIEVGYSDGFEPTWKNGAIAGTVVASFVISFMLMLILIESQSHADLLREMLPKKALSKIKKGETVVEKYKIATVLFADIVGYTNLSSEMSAIEVMKMLNEFYSEIDKIASKHKVCKIQTIGDAYMVAGGVPDRCLGTEGAQKVALFALEIIDFVKKFRTQGGAQLFLRAGINSGPLVAGVVGTKRPQYTVFGDTVNAAARMESTSQKMMIQCSSMTYRLLRDAPTHVFEFEDRGDVEIKGKGNMHTWWVTGVAERTESCSFVQDIASEGFDEGMGEVDDFDREMMEYEAVIAGQLDSHHEMDDKI